MLADACFPPDRNPKTYVCGPTPFVEDVSSFLVELGHDALTIKTERFRTHRRMKAMTENDLDFVLDGNAAAGAPRLREVFAADVTTAHIQCDACGSVGALEFSALLCRARWEVVLRCSNCARPSLLRGGPHAAWPLAGNEGRAPPPELLQLEGRDASGN